MDDMREYHKMALELMQKIDTILTKHGIWYSLAYGSVLGAVREHGIIPWDGDIDIQIKYPDQKKVRELLRTGLDDKYKLVAGDRECVNVSDEIDFAGISSDIIHIDIYPIIAGPDNLVSGIKWMKKCKRIHRLLACKYLDFDRIRRRWKIPAIYCVRAVEHLIPDVKLQKIISKMATKYSFDEATYYFCICCDAVEGEYMEKELIFNVKRVPFNDLLLPVPSNTNEYLTRLYGKDYMTPIKY